MNKIPLLDLAPKRKKPLSFWNPLDYVVLLYWLFFFPRAFRWHREKFSLSQRISPDSGLGEQSDGPPLAISSLHEFRQTGCALIAIALALATSGWLLVSAEISHPWQRVIFDIGLGVLSWLVVGVFFGLLAGLSRKLYSCIGIGFAFMVSSGLFLFHRPETEIAEHLPLYVMVSVYCAGAVAISVSSCTLKISSIRLHANVGLAIGYIAGLTSLILVGPLLFSSASDLTGDALADLRLDLPDLVVVLVAAFVAGSTRFVDWLCSAPFVWITRGTFWSRTTWLPLPGLSRVLKRWLEDDWSTGTRNINELLANSLQTISAVRAVKNALAESPRETLLPRVAVLSRKPADGIFLRYLSIDFGQEIISGLWPFGQGEIQKLQFGDPARAACAGFWLWYEAQTWQARKAFGFLRDFSYGEELYLIASTIAQAEQITTIDDFAQWNRRVARLEKQPKPYLRDGTVKMLFMLRSAIDETIVESHAYTSLANRSLGFSRASGLLNSLLENGFKICPEPEWHLVRPIIARWLDIIIKAGGEAAREALLQPTLNPYAGYSGLPVRGEAFIGRNAVIHKIEAHWSSSDPPTLILYGHRRMGKTSILHNLEPTLPEGSLLVNLDMQNIGWIDHTGELLLDVAEAVHGRILEAGLDPGPPPDPDLYQSLGTARRAINAFLARLATKMTGERRLVLAIDEFELIEDGIETGRIDPGLLPYFRSLNQSHRWLALIFAGLHTLDEIGRDYQSAFYGQTEHVRVGYLKHDDAVDLIARPHPDFTLDYAAALIEEIIRLTNGQPYLVQRLCWELVRRWNERFLKVGEKLPRLLDLPDLEPVLDADLYAAAEYYFEGVWNNVTPEERDLMVVLARRETPWPRPELLLAAKTSEEELVQTLEHLSGHDVIVENADQDQPGVKFASELLRRWVARYRGPAAVASPHP